MSLPGPLRTFGKKHVEQFARWLPTLTTYGTATALTGLYFTDWKVIAQYVPFYGGKFSE